MHGRLQVRRGFTLVEMLMGVVVLAILAALAMPSYARLIAKTRQRTSLDVLAVGLDAARTAAVTRSNEVAVCPSEDQASCTRTTQWQHGWILFADIDRNGKRSADEPLIAVEQAQPAGIGIVTSSGRPLVAFRPDGSTAGTNLRLTVCDRDAKPGSAYSLVLNLAGRLRSAPAPADAERACLLAAD